MSNPINEKHECFVVDDDPYGIEKMFSVKPDAPPIPAPQAPIGVVRDRASRAGAYQSVASKIRIAIKTRQLTQKSAAGQLGISEQYLSDIVKGRRSVSAFVAVRLESVLGLDAQETMCAQVREELKKAYAEYRSDAQRK